MPHMVVFRTNEGKNGYHQAETLDEAVRFVEHLRNNEQVAESKVYRMDEVPIEFKVMYKVEVAGAAIAPAQNDDGGTAEAVRAAEPPTATPPPRAPAGGDGRSETVRATAPAGATGAAPTSVAGPTGTGAPSPVSQTGGRFGLFSRS